MRAIDGDKIVKILNECIDMILAIQGHLEIADNPKLSAELQAYKDMLEDINEMPTIEPELPWIPCKKQLPVEEGDYFVTVDPRYVPPGYRSTDVITWRDGKWVMADYFVLDSEGRKKPDFKVVELAVPIIAWMPLPKEYQEATDGTGID